MRKLVRGVLIAGLLVTSLGLVGTTSACDDVTGPECGRRDSPCAFDHDCCSRSCRPPGLTEVIGTCR